MNAHPREVLIYEDRSGRAPFVRWFDGLKDRKAKEKIQTRLARVRLGNFGDCRPVGGGVLELRIHHGPGYRVYFAEEDRHHVVLLSAGSKQTQAKDIAQAQSYWEDWRKTSYAAF